MKLCDSLSVVNVMVGSLALDSVSFVFFFFPFLSS
jgi:hypothetical protein